MSAGNPRITIRLHPLEIDWLKSQGEPSTVIRRLVQKAMPRTMGKIAGRIQDLQEREAVIVAAIQKEAK